MTIPTQQPIPTDSPTLTPAQRERIRCGEIEQRLRLIPDLAATLGALDVARWIAACSQHYRAQSRIDEIQAINFDACDLGAYVNACMDAAAVQLTPNGEDGWIVIDDDELPPRWAISWRGMFRLVRRAVKAEGGDAKSFCAEIVYQEEIDRGGFDADLFCRTMKHRPWYLLGLKEEPMAGSIALVYAAVTIVAPDGTESREFRIITRADLEQRQRSATIANGGKLPRAWAEWFRAQARKTAVRALVDWLPSVDAVRVQLAAAPRMRSAPLALTSTLRALTDGEDAPRVAMPEHAGAHVVATPIEEG